MSEERHVKSFDITGELLLRLMAHMSGDIPDGTTLVKIVEVDRNPYLHGPMNELRLYIEHPSFPLVREGEIAENFVPLLSYGNLPASIKAHIVESFLREPTDISAQ